MANLSIRKLIMGKLYWFRKNIKKMGLFEKAIRRNASIGSVFQNKYFSFAMIAVGSLNVNGIHIINKEKLS